MGERRDELVSITGDVTLNGENPMPFDVVKITKNYLCRVKKNENVKPMYNADPEVQAAEEARVIEE